MSAHEDSPVVGSAWRAPQRAELLRRIDDLGATVVRAHYPLHPALMEALDRRGVLVWDQATVNQVQNDQMRRPAVRGDALRAVEALVLRDRGHPSVLAFSIANELPVPVSQGQIDFVLAAAARVRELDPTRLVAIDRVARYGAPDDGHRVFRAVDAIGANEYFGWYRGAFPPRPPATTRDLASYLDTLHRKQPHAALFLTEFGAEANRRGRAREKGTYAFQARYLRDHLRVASTHPYVSGAMVWNLRDFRVYPGWSGGNPKPSPPYNAKGPDRHRRQAEAGVLRGSAAVPKRQLHEPLSGRARTPGVQLPGGLMKSRLTFAVALATVMSLALTVVVAQAGLRGDHGDGPRSAASYINPDKGMPTFNPDVDPGSSCAGPDRRDRQPFSDAGTTSRNVHNDACLFLSRRSHGLSRSDVNGIATFDSRGVGEISACPDPDNAGPATATRSDTDGDGRFDRCTQTSFQQKGTAGDAEWHARMNNDGSARLGGTGRQRVKFCYDPDADGCADESVTDKITIRWGVPNGSAPHGGHHP